MVPHSREAERIFLFPNGKLLPETSEVFFDTLTGLPAAALHDNFLSFSMKPLK